MFCSADLPDKIHICPVYAVANKQKGMILKVVHYKYDPSAKAIDTSQSWVEKRLREIQEKHSPVVLNPLGEAGWAYISHRELHL